MNAAPLLQRIAEAAAAVRLEMVLIGNAAAALQGAPVTTLDVDAMFRKTPANLNKVKRLADLLGAQVLKPYYPVSDLYRVVNEDAGLQLDLMTQVHGIRSFAGLKARAAEVTFGGASLRVASLDDIIKSKRAAGRARDKAVLPVLERTREEQAKPS